MNEGENLTLWDPAVIPAQQAYKTDRELINGSFAENKETLIRGVASPELKDELITVLPFSDLIMRYQEGSVIYEGAIILDIQRLRRVKSLSRLTYRMVDPNGGSPIVFADLPEDRLNHSLVVAMTSEAIAKNIGLPQEDVRRLSVAALLHDRATPALGDATKKVDMENLHEETHWDEGLSEEAWDFIHSLGANRQMIDQIIRNDEHDTLMGQILDIADKISYVMLDLKQTGFAGNYTDLGDIYKDVSFDQKTGRLYFKNFDRLADFLDTRAMLFTRVYLSEYSQATDYVFERILAPFYSTKDEEGKLSPQKLRQMSDQQLMEFLASQYEMTQFWFEKSGIWQPEVRQFATQEEADAFVEDLNGDPKYFALGIKQGQGFNPGLHLNVLDEVDGIVPYGKSPESNDYILRTLAKFTGGYFVIYYDSDMQGLRKFFRAELAPQSPAQ